jgi:mannose-6-phosphate isomerase-like protein (cupin superfamily)
MSSGYRIVALPKLPKLERGVRFPLPAPIPSLPRASILSTVPALVCAAVAALAAPPLSAGDLVTPEGRQGLPAWTEEQRSANIARSPVFQSGEFSAFYLRLKGREQPHFHADTALLVVLLEGRGVVHFPDRDVDIAAGDTVLIPRGVEHWAENTGADAMVVFAAVSPGPAAN